MIQTALRNPFLAIKVDDTATLPAGDVPELHARVREKCRLALAQAQQSEQSIGLMVIGEAGSGKSHLIARLRQDLAGNTRTVLATISLRGAFAGKLWRHVRARLVAELLRSYPGSEGLNGLLRILHNQFPTWASEQNAKGGLFEILIGRAKTGLNSHLHEFAQTCTLDYALQKVLCKLENRHAQAWLRGQQLDATDLAELGLPPAFPSEQEQETASREVVLSLFRLAGTATTLFVCFDEVEAIQAGTYDAASLRQFTTLATDLLAETGPRVVATFIRPNLQMDVSRAVEASNVQKMAQDSTVLPPISWEQTVRLSKARLEAETSCRAARLDYPEQSFWPLSQEFLERVYKENKRSLTPRHLIRACAVEFERLQQGSSVPVADLGLSGDGLSAAKEKRTSKRTLDPRPEPVDISPLGTIKPTDSPSSPPPDDRDFVRMWEKVRQKYLKKPQEIKFDRTLAIALPWLVHLIPVALVWIQEPEDCPGDVNLLFHPKSRGRKRLGISFCNHEPRLLWHRLDRLLRQWSATMGTTLGSLIILRAQSERTTEAAETRLTKLTQAGARVMRVETQPLAELAAYQTLLMAAQTGDLTRSGKPVEVVEYDAWVKETLSSAVKEFIDLVFQK